MIGYKLTNVLDQTRGATQWGVGVTHRSLGQGTAFCSPDLIHFYSSPLVALLHDPIHGNFGPDGHLWQIDATQPVYDDRGLKLGARQVTTTQLLPRFELPTAARLHYAILCAKVVCSGRDWLAWANRWLLGKRHADASFAAGAAGAAADAAAAAAAAFAAYAARHAAARHAPARHAAGYAASAAAFAAYAASAAAASAAARHAASAGAFTASAAAASSVDIDFPALALVACVAECPPGTLDWLDTL